MQGLEQRLATTLDRYAAATRVEPPPLDALAGRADDEAGVGATVPIRGRRRVIALVAAALLATTAAGAGAYQLLIATESATNPGQELYCSNIELLPPSEVEAELEARGYVVDWQYYPDTDDLEQAQRRRPPDENTVIVDVTVVDGEAIVLAEGFDPDDPLHQRRRAGVPQHPECLGR